MAYIKIKRINGNDYCYLVESYRKNGKVKKRTLKYLGKASPEKIAEINISERKISKPIKEKQQKLW